jgi:signal transduction histidine kinase
MNITHLSGYEVYLNGELCYPKAETPKTATELIIANLELVFENKKQVTRACELQTANEELKKAQNHQKEYISGLEKMIFMISHKVRQPIVSIVGLTNILNLETGCSEHLMKLFGHIRKSASDMDTFTRELTYLMADLHEKADHRK